MKEWYYMEGDKRKHAKARIKENYSIKQLEELKIFFKENIDYCKEKKHKNLNYWKYELKFINECIKEF